MTAEIAGFALLVCAASVVQGFLGFGYGVIVMSVLTLSTDLVHATAFVNLSSLALSVVIVAREHPRILWPVAIRVLPTMFVGMAVGLMALRELDRDLMVRILGVTIVAIACWNVASPRLRTRESFPLDLLFGGVSGLFSGAFNTGGPPLVIHLYRRRENPLALIVTLQAIFIASGVVRAVMAGSQGLIPSEAALRALYVLPVIVLGTLGGMTLARRTHPDRFRRVAWIGLGLLGAALIVGS